ncbi:MAG: hypothetical protein GY856_08885 [bacterium]|nr:hypothetical protein [bacterium]
MMRKNRHLPRSLTLAVLVGLLALAHPALAGSGSCTPTNELLLPYFEVRPQQLELTTIFVLTNLSSTPADVTIDVKNRNGNRVLRKNVAFAKFQEQVFDLGDWFKSGDLTLTRFADPKRPKVAVGYVAVKATTPNFCGNFYIIQDAGQEDGEMLIDPTEGLCKTHALLLRKAGVFDSDSVAAIWVRSGPDTLQAFGYDKAGKRHTLNQVALVRTQIVTLKELGWREELDIQWLELVNKQRESFVLARYFDDENRGSMLRTCCFKGGGPPPPPPPAGCLAKLTLDKKTNGKDDAGEIPPGSTVQWTYTVKNAGSVALVKVKVVDDPMPANLKCDSVAKLDPGKTMSCTASGKAVAGPFTNTATVTAVSAGDPACKAEARDSSGYQGSTDCSEKPGIKLDKKTNGKDNAGQVAVGSTVKWTYTIRNTGDVALAKVKVVDSPMPANLKCGNVAKLKPGKAMSCTASGKAISGPFTNTATVTAESAGKPACRTEVQATDSSGYKGACTEGPAKLTLDKKTNGKNNAGQIAAGSEVTWTYVVRNTGQATIKNLKLVDSPPEQISCTPDVTVLKAGESMNCTAKGTAVEGNFKNTATVTGVTECKQKAVKASANSKYKGVSAGDDRFMTGGAFIDNTPFGKFDVQITKLNCDGSPPNNLNVEWGGKGNQRQKFKMQKLTSVTCSDTPGVDPGQPAASFDTAVGTGTGKVKGQNATIQFKFIDAGEPGTNDQFDVTIKFGNETIHVAGKIDGGNYQAHK